jgi:low affinity Fe/Cu permease
MTKKFAQLANWVAVMSGHPVVFGFAIFTVVAWMVTGPFFSFSDTWQLVMNTWTNVATFLMVFLSKTRRIETARQFKRSSTS